jgi:hypothetical protein
LARPLATSGAAERDDLAVGQDPEDTAVRPGPGPGDAGARRPAWRWGLLVGAGWVIMAALRIWFSRAQTVPLANPDESAYLIAARVLAGGPAADFSYSTLYQGGYPLLITPVFWFTHNPVTAYHGVLFVNALVSALLMPLAYVAGRRLELTRPMAYALAVVTALVPAGFIYAEYAMTDAIYPVVMLAWLLTVHSWLTARTASGRYAAAAGSALLAGYSYAVHSRGLVVIVGYVLLAALAGWRRLVPWLTVAVAALGTALSAGAGWLLDGYLAQTIYPEGTRSLSGQVETKLHSVSGAINVFEMAAGQLWRLVLDSWGLAGIGLFAALAVIASRRFRPELRIMAALTVAVTLVTAGISPAALPPDQSQTWASGRYLDGMIVTLFIAGAVVLLRARPRFVLACAAATVVLTAGTAAIVAVYAGSSLPTGDFPSGFNFAEPAVLAQNWTSANVFVSSAVAVGLLAVWVGLALAARHWSARAGALPRARTARVAWVPWIGLAAGLAVVSLVAVTQFTSHVSRAATPAQEASTSGFVQAAGLKPGGQLAVADSSVSYALWAPQTVEVYWGEVEFFTPPQDPPAGTDVVETGWTAGQSAAAGWPGAPAGWHIVASSQAGGWVAWRHS